MGNVELWLVGLNKARFGPISHSAYSMAIAAAASAATTTVIIGYSSTHFIAIRCDAIVLLNWGIA